MLFLLLMLTYNVMAAEVAVTKVYFESDTCEGLPMMVWNGVVNQCKQIPGGSLLYTCTSFQSFPTLDCTGEPNDEVTFASGCQSNGFLSNLAECVSYPDEEIFLLETGTHCTEEGNPEGGYTPPIYVVIDICLSVGSTNSHIYTQTENGFQITEFYEKGDCTGASDSITLAIETCVVTDPSENEETQIVKKISPGVLSPTESPAESPTEPPTEPPAELPTEPPTDDDNEDGNPGTNGTGNGSDTMAGSSICVVALIAALAVAWLQ